MSARRTAPCSFQIRVFESRSGDVIVGALMSADDLVTAVDTAGDYAELFGGAAVLCYSVDPASGQERSVTVLATFGVVPEQWFEDVPPTL